MPRLEQDHLMVDPFTEYVKECLIRIGKRFDRCEYCNNSDSRLTMHHTVYDGATVYDIDIICYKCNLSEENLRLV